MARGSTRHREGDALRDLTRLGRDRDSETQLRGLSRVCRHQEATPCSAA